MENIKKTDTFQLWFEDNADVIDFMFEFSELGNCGITRHKQNTPELFPDYEIFSIDFDDDLI